MKTTKEIFDLVNESIELMKVMESQDSLGLRVKLSQIVRDNLSLINNIHNNLKDENNKRNNG